MSAARKSASTFLPVLLIALAAPAAAQQAAQSPQTAPPGGELYQKLCSQCHGVNGDGKGIATQRVLPRPRDFTAGKFKIRHTPSGALPTDDDLRDVIREGMPYTSMPAWKHLSDDQINELIAAVKSFSPDFKDAEKTPKPIQIPEAPAYTEESAKKGKQVYADIGCGACHGEIGRGDGISAPTLTDDWGNPLRPADLTKRWTYRGGPTREDIYRTFTTGMNGTPMPSFAESLTDEQRWQLVDYIVSLDGRETPDYAELIQVQFTPDEIALEKGKELFASAPAAHFPVVGQITEPGRAFHPATNSVTVKAVYNSREIAFLVTWHDMRADISGRNAPDLVVPPEEDRVETAAPAAPGGEGGDDVWGEDAAPADAGDGGDVWGEDAAPEEPAVDEGGADAAASAGETDVDDFFGEEAGSDAAAGPGSEFSDAVAIQLPVQIPSGARKPYFLFGDGSNPVDLWFVDLATKVATRYNGTGNKSLTLLEGEDVTAVATYDRGEWSVIFKRALRATGGVTFAEGQYVPIAFSIWNGTDRERGNKRGLTRWMYLYTLPRETPSALWPMLRAALIVLAVEILLIAWVRRRFAARPDRDAQDRKVPVHV